MTSQIQRWDPKQYRTDAGYVSELGKPVLELLAPEPGERILDLGCGDGVLTLEMARLGCDVVGIDASDEMVTAARAAGVEAHVGDGAALTFAGEFDAVFSNAALHWIKPPEAAIAGVWRALRPGGRFVGEFGGSGNVAKILAAIDAALRRRGRASPNPWFFPTADEYAAMLSAAGFSVRTVALFARPTRLPGDARAWLEIFAKHHLAAVPAADRDGLVAEIVADLRDGIVDDEGNWFADYVRLRFRAEKPDGL